MFNFAMFVAKILYHTSSNLISIHNLLMVVPRSNFNPNKEWRHFFFASHFKGYLILFFRIFLVRNQIWSSESVSKISELLHSPSACSTNFCTCPDITLALGPWYVSSIWFQFLMPCSHSYRNCWKLNFNANFLIEILAMDIHNSVFIFKYFVELADSKTKIIEELSLREKLRLRAGRLDD